MNKAEERALEKYPFIPNDDKEGLEALKYIGMECECASVFNEAQKAKQVYFIEGYHQAEKDNELTWKDMAEIVKIANLLEIEWLNSTPWDGIRDWGFYTEVLKRFKAQKGK